MTFGTHISKGIHLSARGDNVNFVFNRQLPNTLIGTHSLTDPVLDASGHAAALPLATFFDFDVADGLKIRDLILQNHAGFISSLSDDERMAAIIIVLLKSPAK